MVKILANVLQKDINQTLPSLLNAGVFLDIKRIKFKQGKLTSHKSPRFIKREEEYPGKFIEIYENKEYLALLKDGSLITTLYEFSSDGKTLKKATLIYYPNPNLKLNLYDDLSSNEEDDPINEKSLLHPLSNYLRIDYDIASANEVCHPVTHIHIGFLSKFRMGMNNLPPFSDFIELILFLYYPIEWNKIYIKDKPIDTHILKRNIFINKICCDGKLSELEKKYRYFYC